MENGLDVQSGAGGEDTGPGQAWRHEVQAACEVLEKVVADRTRLLGLSEEERTRLIRLAGDVYCPDVRERRRLVKARVRQEREERVSRDSGILADTGIRVMRRKPVYLTPNVFPPRGSTLGEGDEGRCEPERGAVGEPQNCYVCKRDYREIHFFYDQLCPECAAFNYAKRGESADLRGRVALLTGGRVKIGYQAGIKLLRAGARLIVTTRFPRDAAARFGRETDFEEWRERLEIYGLDLRHTPSVEAFCRHMMGTQDRLDFIINNACQTVRRPPDFYGHMMEREARAFEKEDGRVKALVGRYEAMRGNAAALERGGPGAGEVAGLVHAAALSQVRMASEDWQGGESLFPRGALDQDLQQVDARGVNSWRLTLAEVSAVELLEVQLVNAVAPFVLNGRLKGLMLRTPERDKHIVNVSAVEGQFYRKFKTTRHPHTNMAKAALNMMTRTSAAEYEADGIHMNSVDTGWVTDEDPIEIAQRKQREHRFHPPLDIVDGAARIVDPIIGGFNTGTHVWGKFLKDYKPTDW